MVSIQFITHRGLGELKEWLNDGYDVIQEWDDVYSDWFDVPNSIKTTSVKPSGTVSLLAGYQVYIILKVDSILEELGFQNIQNY